MRVNSPLMSDDARGALGPGAVFGKGMGTNWVRERVRTPLRRTRAAVLARNRLAKSARSWSGLTDEQRAAWEDYASGIVRYDSLGQPYSVDGHTEYNGVQACLDLIEEQPSVLPPSLPTSPIPPQIQWFYYWDEYGGQFSIQPTWAYSSDYIIIFFSRPKNLGQVPYENETYFVTWASGGQYSIAVRVPRDGRMYTCRCRWISGDGKAGGWSVWPMVSAE